MLRIDLLMLFLRSDLGSDGRLRVFARSSKVGADGVVVGLGTGNMGECVMDGSLDASRAGLCTASSDDALGFS